MKQDAVMRRTILARLRERPQPWPELRDALRAERRWSGMRMRRVVSILLSTDQLAKKDGRLIIVKGGRECRFVRLMMRGVGTVARWVGGVIRISIRRAGVSGGGRAAR